MFTEVLVPFDGSDEARRAVEIAAGIARAANKPLRILAHTSKPETPVDSPELRDVIDVMKSRYDLNPEVTLAPKFRFLADELVDEVESRPGTVLCIPTQGRGRMAVFTGSTTTDVLTYNDDPVVLVGPKCERNMFEHDGPMVIALDGSDEAETIIPVAHAWAKLFDLPVDVVTVLDPEPTPELAAAVASGDVLESNYVARIIESSELSEDDATFEVRHGKPAEEILRAAVSSNASMIAMSSHVPLGVDRLLHGSVLDSVTRDSPVPVLALNCRPA